MKPRAMAPAGALALLALSALASGQPERAGRFWGAVLAETELGDVPVDEEFHRVTAPLRESSDPGFRNGVELGRDVSFEDAVALGLALEPR